MIKICKRPWCQDGGSRSRGSTSSAVAILVVGSVRLAEFTNRLDVEPLRSHFKTTRSVISAQAMWKKPR
jgi:hypothetical protein